MEIMYNRVYCGERNIAGGPGMNHNHGIICAPGYLLIVWWGRMLINDFVYTRKVWECENCVCASDLEWYDDDGIFNVKCTVGK